ncbi:glutamic acid and leucine-rich protein 1, Proline [Lucilia cuprina]|nr:glutamic acid and leucine-rich protein 1, Proline [Lucilia cuprina]
MESYLSIFQGILSTEGTFLDIYLNGLEDHRKFSIQSNEGAEIVQNITSLLTKSTSRSLGLRLLTKYIDLCPIEVLEKKGNLWITLVLKAFNSQELNCDALLIFEVLGKIIKRSLHSTDLAKSFASTHISKVYENLTKVSQFQVKYALSCIETCLRTYPGSSGPSKGVLERFLWKNVDHLDGEVVQNCGKCLHLLQQVKGGGVQGVNHKTQWKNYQLQLIGGIHSVYNEMFSNCAEIYEEKIEQVKFPWEAEQHKFDAEPVRKAAQMYTRCHNMIKYLIIALSEPFPVEKPILVRKVLNVVVRGLSVNCLMLEQNPIADNIALSILLPKIHVDLFELLKVAVLILRGHVRPYSELILGLIIDALKWTSTKSSHSEQKTLLVLRKQVYETASLWCKILNSGNRCETVAEYLFQEIFSDITPTQSEFTLKVLGGARKHMSKKARRQLHNAQNENSNMCHTHSSDSNRKGHFSQERNQELCIAALRCLQQIILSISNFIKPTTLKVSYH